MTAMNIELYYSYSPRSIFHIPAALLLDRFIVGVVQAIVLLYKYQMCTFTGYIFSCNTKASSIVIQKSTKTKQCLWGRHSDSCSDGSIQLLFDRQKPHTKPKTLFKQNTKSFVCFLGEQALPT